MITRPVIKIVFDQCDIELNGNRSYDIQVLNEKFYALLVLKGAPGFYESYMLKYIECEDLEKAMKKFFKHPAVFYGKWHPYRIFKYWVHILFDILDENHSHSNLEHYDELDDYILEMSDRTAHYSCMMLDDINEIENANEEQLEEIMFQGAMKMRDLVARKLKLEPGMTVLDIGCGYGGLAKYLAETYKVHVTGVTISKGMADYARKTCKGLDVEILHMDYRRVTGKFDRIVSVEMFEHVGGHHHREYFEKVNSLLKESGLFVLQAHHFNHSHLSSYQPIGENGIGFYLYLPRLEETMIASKGLFILEHLDCHAYRFGVTCKAMAKMFEFKKNKVVNKHSEQFLRHMNFCGSVGIATTEAVLLRLYQIVFSKNGLLHTYTF